MGQPERNGLANSNHQGLARTNGEAKRCKGSLSCGRGHDRRSTCWHLTALMRPDPGRSCRSDDSGLAWMEVEISPKLSRVSRDE